MYYNTLVNQIRKFGILEIRVSSENLRSALHRLGKWIFYKKCAVSLSLPLLLIYKDTMRNDLNLRI